MCEILAIILIMFFVIELFPIDTSYQFFKNCWILINHDLFFQEKNSLQLYYVIPILRIFWK